jgi:hypothetical protein
MSSFAFNSVPQFDFRMAHKVEREQPHGRRKQDALDREARIKEHEWEIRRLHMGRCFITEGVEV